MARRSDERPEVEIIGAQPEPEVVSRIAVGPSRSTRRTQIVVLTAVVVVIVGGLLVGGNEDPAGEREAEDAGGEEPSAAEQGDEGAGAASTVPAPGLTTSVVGDGAAPVFGEPVGAAVLIGGEHGEWRLIDLDTGTLHDVPALDDVPPDAMVPVQGGVVVLDPRRPGLANVVELPGGDAAPLQVPFPVPPDQLRITAGVAPSGMHDRVWLVFVPTGPPDPDATLLAVLAGLDGEAHQQLALRRWPSFATASGVVHSTGGRTFVQDDTGTRPLGDGTAHAASSTEVAVLSCDDEARCRADVIDVETGARRAGLPLPDASETALWMSLSSAGDLATLPASPQSLRRGGATEGGRALLLQVLDRDGRLESTIAPSIISAPAWLPGGQGLVVLTGYGLVRYVDEGDGLIGQRAAGLRTAGDDTVLVVPHA